ncbi:putative Rz1-like protein [Pseudomonas phage Bertil]|uniref:Putative Rz1-like protein n=1 Tax=Pseudomonas phage Bertil TaxID=2801385 RepID=A0A7T8EQK7_9CAUD|nr:putative Rz1-like protein [Pseudomonas phage Bertil]QQO90919.1 putative Rz1-like protein [Pseudomonas phage Strit]
MRFLSSATLLCLCLSLTACASVSAVNDPVPCVHPLVDPRTAGGMAQGLLDYHAALELCNSLNGVQPNGD